MFKLQKLTEEESFYRLLKTQIPDYLDKLVISGKVASLWSEESKEEANQRLKSRGIAGKFAYLQKPEFYLSKVNPCDSDLHVAFVSFYAMFYRPDSEHPDRSYEHCSQYWINRDLSLEFRNSWLCL